MKGVVVLGRSPNLVGREFGFLRVLEFAGKDERYRAFWKCRCLRDGNEVVVYAHNLLRGTSTSCGCVRREYMSNSRKTHGQSRGATYRSWHSMIERCTRKSHPGFHRYGGRGITVCDEWLNSFEAFLRDMGERPGPRMTLDRYPNNDGNYEPGNCRWATWKEQARNKSSRSKSAQVANK